VLAAAIQINTVPPLGAIRFTLGGELTDGAGKKVSDLTLVSLWIPAHESRTYALVDTERGLLRAPYGESLKQMEPAKGQN